MSQCFHPNCWHRYRANTKFCQPCGYKLLLGFGRTFRAIEKFEASIRGTAVLCIGTAIILLFRTAIFGWWSPFVVSFWSPRLLFLACCQMSYCLCQSKQSQHGGE